MRKIKNKLKKIIDYAFTYKKYKMEFNNKVAIFSFLAFLFHKDNSLGRLLTRTKEETIKEYLYKSTPKAQKKYKNIAFENKKIEEDSNIWFLWWQGYKEMPELVSTCYESITKNAKNHKVIFLDKNNFNKYIDLPDYITKKYNNGNICSSNFSDILRVSLLSKYGGVWLDATILMIAPFNEEIYSYSFCSNKRKNQQTSLLYPAHCRWGAYFLACGKENILVNYVRDVFYEYWKKHNTSIDYVIVDFIIALGHDTNKIIADQIDNSPYSNEYIHSLLSIINEPYDINFFKQHKDTNIYKLSYKRQLNKYISGKKTFYGYLFDHYSKKSY